MRTEHDSIKWILNLSDANGGLAQWRLWFSKLDFDKVSRAGGKQQAADTMSGLRTAGEKRIDLDDDLLVCNIKNTQVTDEETPYAHVCTECDVKKEMDKSKSNEEPAEKAQTRVITV